VPGILQTKARLTQRKNIGHNKLTLLGVEGARTDEEAENVAFVWFKVKVSSTKCCTETKTKKENIRRIAPTEYW
jgi:hypothetical protein